MIQNRSSRIGYRHKITNLLLSDIHTFDAAFVAGLLILCVEILSFQLSQLEVFSFASSPALDLQSAQAVESFATKIVNNNIGVIPRMKVASIRLTVELLKMLGQIA